jgi:hypothetical protein
MNTIACDDKATAFDELVQGRVSINVEMPVELLVDGLHIPRPVEGTVEALTEAHRVFALQILPAKATRQFPQDAFEKDTIIYQRLTTAIFTR